MSALTPSGPARTGTPKPAVLPTGPGRPTSSHPQANPSQSRARTPVGIGTPRSVSTPTTSAAPVTQLSTSASAPVAAQMPTPVSSQGADAKRGVKREREADGPPVNGSGVALPQQNLNGNGVVRPVTVVNAKAGSGGIRPRPVKKQRQDLQGNAREMPIQQPTPHA